MTPRGPDPDLEDDRVVAEVMARLAAMNLRGYHEADSGDKRLLQWLLGAISTLLVSSVIGGVVVYGKLQAVLDHQEASDHRLDRIENRLDGRSGTTRGGGSVDNSIPP